jgi:hypothetical protein
LLLLLLLMLPLLLLLLPLLLPLCLQNASMAAAVCDLSLQRQLISVASRGCAMKSA